MDAPRRQNSKLFQIKHPQKFVSVQVSAPLFSLGFAETKIVESLFSLAPIFCLASHRRTFGHRRRSHLADAGQRAFFSAEVAYWNQAAQVCVLCACVRVPGLV
jgi:hypothetical protein